MIQGICRHFWVESEFPKFKRIIDQFHDDDLSLIELYNVQFEKELVKDSNLEFSEDDIDFEQEEDPTSEAVEDLLLDKIDLCNGLFHFLSVQGDGRKIPGLVKSMNFQRSTAKSPKIPEGWQQFATKFIEIEIFTLTDFSRQSCRCKQEFQGKKGKNIFHGTRVEDCTSTKSFRHSRMLVVHPLTFSGGFSKGKTCQGSFSRHYYSDDRKFHSIF